MELGNLASQKNSCECKDYAYSTHILASWWKCVQEISCWQIVLQPTLFLYKYNITTAWQKSSY